MNMAEVFIKAAEKIYHPGMHATRPPTLSMYICPILNSLDPSKKASNLFTELYWDPAIVPFNSAWFKGNADVTQGRRILALLFAAEYARTEL